MDKVRHLQDNLGESERDGQFTPSSHAVQVELEKILASKTLGSAHSQRKFLRYVVEEAIAGRGDLIKEYVIGMEALGRGESFDPRLDPIVRTQARKLRASLVKYYATEGAGDPLRIEFLKGTYAPSFRMAEAPDPLESGQVSIASFSPSPERRPAARRQRWSLGGIALLVIAAAGSCSAVLYLLVSDSWRGAPSADRRSIAVLPFTNLSEGNDDEFLSDGLTGDLIDSLAQVRGMQVVARTSALRFKGKNQDIREIGEKLNVRTVLVGSVRRSSDRLQITIHLNNAADGNRLWSGSYDRDAKDARAIQWEIARAVTNVLSAGPGSGSGDSTKRFPNVSSPNPSAYQNYLKGLYFWNKLTVSGLKMAVEYFQQAIADDPSFARAYATLAYCYVMAPQVASSPTPEVITKIKAAALKAHELDPKLGEAHILLGVSAEYDFDWATAEREFRKGLELSPGSAMGHLWFAKYLALVGRKQEVLKERRIAAELDPVSPYALDTVAWCYLASGRYDDAIEQFRGALPLDPDFGFTHQGLGTAYLLKGMNAQAIEELQRAYKVMGGPRRLAFLGHAYAVSGNTREARRILNGFLEQHRQGRFPALAIAFVYIGLGDKDEAFHWLEKSIDQRDLNLCLLWDSFYDPLRSDPRFSGLLRRMKLV